MSATIVITNNSKKFKIDLTRENTIQYRINSNDNENTGDNFVNIKFFLNTDYVYNSTDSIVVVVSSYLNDTVVRYEEFIFKFEDMFFDKLINLNTDYITIFLNNSGLSLTELTYAELHGNITQIKIPLVSRIYGSSNVPVKTDIYGRLDISGQIVDISGQRIDISNQKVDISGQRVDISGQRVDISGQCVIVTSMPPISVTATADISGQRVDISGQRVDISGQCVIVTSMPPISVTVDISGQRVDISGQRVDISGQTVIVQGGIDISGQTVDISGQRVDISGQTVIVQGGIDISGQRVDISGQRVDISGQTVIVQGGIDISGQTVDISGQRVDISGQSIIVTSMPPISVTATADISGQRVDISGQRVDISGQTIINNDYILQFISQNINNGIEYSNIKLNSIDNYSSSILNNAILTNTKLGYNKYDNDRLKIYDASANTLLTTINNGIGSNIGVFAFGNFLSNVTITGESSSSTITFTNGDYGRKTMLIYRDNATSNTDSISFYSNTTTGVATNVLLAIFYPIVDNGYRWSNIIVNLLPFTSILVRNNSASSITGVYLTVTNA
jgi:adhesin HecA-like repeat protein